MKKRKKEFAIVVVGVLFALMFMGIGSSRTNDWYMEKVREELELAFPGSAGGVESGEGMDGAITAEGDDDQDEEDEPEEPEEDDAKVFIG
jgi:hypothetical protein